MVAFLFFIFVIARLLYAFISGALAGLEKRRLYNELRKPLPPPEPPSEFILQMRADLRRREQKTLYMLHVLGLREVPTSVEDLKRARNDRLKAVHPDVGGTANLTMEVNTAYQHVLGYVHYNLDKMAS